MSLQLASWIALLFQLHEISATCEKIDYSKYVLRSSTTMYDDVRGYGRIDHEGCEPLQIWGIFRHGTRHNYAASSRRIKKHGEEMKTKIKKAYSDGRSQLCPDDLNAIASWYFDDLVTYEAHHLTKIGWAEMRSLGKRFRNLFPEILNVTYDPNEMSFGVSDHQRTIASYYGFTEGLFEEDPGFNALGSLHYSEIADFDCHMQLLKTYEPHYEMYPPVGEFSAEMKIFEKVAESITNRTGLPAEHVTEEVIRSFYESCTYESAKIGRISPWCRIFRLDDLEWMGYREEFVHYSFTSYGSKHANEVGCFQMKDLISTFDQTISGGDHQNQFIAYFSHDVVVEEMITRLGCFKDPVPITADYSLFTNGKKWNYSEIAPFGANVIAVLLRCPDMVDDYKIQFYLNENPIGCCQNGSAKACSWKQFRESMANFVLNCKENYCVEDSKSSSGHQMKDSYLNWILFLATYQIYYSV